MLIIVEWRSIRSRTAIAIAGSPRDFFPLAGIGAPSLYLEISRKNRYAPRRSMGISAISDDRQPESEKRFIKIQMNPVFDGRIE